MFKQRRNAGFKLALEMIEFQHDTFGQDLERIITDIQGKVVDHIYKTPADVDAGPEYDRLIKCIYDRLGIKVTLITNEASLAILPFYSNKNHIFIDEYLRGNFNVKDQDKILRKANGKKGTVNLEKAKVTGIFTEYENLLYINFHLLFLVYKAGVGEVVGGLLHELGHAFSACEYSDRLETTNQVLADIATKIVDKSEKKDLVYIYKELSSINKKVTEEEVDKLINGNRIIAGYTWFKVIIGTVEEQLGNKKYSDTSFEQVSDNFATRFGYGRQLISLLEKIHKLHGDPEQSKTMFLMSDIFTTLVFIAGAAASMFLISAGIGIGFVYAIILALFFRLMGEDTIDYTYDTLRVRYKRVRNQYVEELKNLKLPADKARVLLSNINSLDLIIEKTASGSILLSKLANFVFSSARDADKSIKEQQLLEELAANDLFVASAQLRTINH